MRYSEGQLLDNRYQLERFVGSGSFGEVWVATDKATDLEVAVKIYVAMDDQGLSEFKKEFQFTFDFNHTNLLHANYLGVNSEDRRPYLVMPFCPEGSVSKYAGNMPEEDIWRFVRDVAAGLAYLHSQQPPVIHQDIKPDNILILKNGDYVITDFGISKQLRASLRKSAMNLNAAGSISYMGPERFSKQYQAVKASDIWSLGVSIYELAVGDVPFCGMGGSLQKKGADIPELPEDDFSPELNRVMQACLAKEPWNRPTAPQLSDYADRVIKGESPEPTWGRKNAAPAAQPAPKMQPQMQPQQQPNAAFNGYPPTVPLGNQYPAMANPAAAQQPGAPVYPQPAYPQQGFQQPGGPQPVFPQPQGQGYPPYAPQKQEGNIPAWVWVLVAVAGLAAGYLLTLVF